MTLFRLNFIASLILIVAGFFVPPVGIIDGSVLTAVGLLLLFALIGQIPQMAKAGKNIRLRKGDFSAEVDTPPQQPDNIR
ncbi:MAG: hypothetical protein J5676_07720 [Bacteroidaceae bacterium]|nr:hypothetical protein [Bacteroidaceae bacterium]